MRPKGSRGIEKEKEYQKQERFSWKMSRIERRPGPDFDFDAAARCRRSEKK